MGTEVVVAYYGVRYVMNDDELEQLEQMEHPLVRAATGVGLEHWWGPLPNNERYYLLIGVELGTLGWEDDLYQALTEMELLTIMQETKNKCRQANFAEPAGLHIQFEPK